MDLTVEAIDRAGDSGRREVEDDVETAEVVRRRARTLGAVEEGATA